jgi:hypothetical protein
LITAPVAYFDLETTNRTLEPPAPGAPDVPGQPSHRSSSLPPSGEAGRLLPGDVTDVMTYSLDCL